MPNVLSGAMRTARIIGLGVAAAGCVWHFGVARALGPTLPADLGDPIQVLADLTAIDGDCRDLSVDFGIGFRYAGAQGLSVSAILPTGRKRPAFEAALRITQERLDAGAVCGALAHHYSVALPGSVTFRPQAFGSGS